MMTALCVLMAVLPSAAVLVLAVCAAASRADRLRESFFQIGTQDLRKGQP